MKRFCTIFAVCLSACSHPITKNHPTTDSTRKVEKSIKSDNKEDAKNYTPEFPIDTIYPANVLTEGIFHEDEVSKTDAKQKWIGLFKTDSLWYLTPFNMAVKIVKDDIVDDAKGPMTGREVKTGNKDTSVLLIAGLPYLTQRPVIPLIKEPTQVLIKKPISITLNGAEYTIYATGDKKILSGPQDYFFKNYKIFIKTTIKGQTYNQQLVSANETTYEMSIVFAGDLDGDDIPDLIINTTKQENVDRPTLYLSKPAGKNELLKVVGLHTTVGC